MPVRLSFILIAALASASLAVADEPIRVWKDVNGDALRGRLQSFDGKTAVIRPTVGDPATLPLDKFDRSGQRYLKRRLKANPEIANGIKSGGGAIASSDAGMPEAGPPADAASRVIPVDASKAKLIMFGGESADWVPTELTVEPVDLKATSAASDIVTFQGRVDATKAPGGAAFNSRTGHAAMSFINRPDAGGTGEATRLVLVDVVNRSVTGLVEHPNRLRPVWTDGEQTLMLTQSYDSDARLELWTWSGLAGARSWTMSPFADQQVYDAPAWATVLADGRLAVASHELLRLVRIADDKRSATVTHEFPREGHCEIGVDPSGQLLAFAHESTVAVFDTRTDTLVGTRTVEGRLAQGRVGVSHDGSRLLIATPETLDVFNISDGRFVTQVPLRGVYLKHGGLDWLGDDRYLVEYSIVDAAAQFELWDHTGAEAVFVHGDRLVFVADDFIRKPNRSAVVVVPADRAEIQSPMERAEKEPKAFALMPGAEVSIDASKVGDAAAQKMVREALTETALDNDLEVVDGGKTVIEASVVRGEKGVRLFRDMRGIGSDQVMTQPYVAVLKVTSGGKVAWERAVSSVPMMLPVGQNETTEQAVRKREKPNPEDIQYIELPRYLMLPEYEGNGPGQSRVTSQGLIPQAQRMIRIGG